MITDTEARRISSEWHGGSGTALDAFSATGAINTARPDHDVIGEINREIERLSPPDPDPMARHDARERIQAKHELRKLRAFIDAHVSTNAGPVPGWSNLTW